MKYLLTLLTLIGSTSVFTKTKIDDSFYNSNNPAVFVHAEYESLSSKKITILTNILSKNSSLKDHCKRNIKNRHCYKLLFVTNKKNLRLFSKKFCGEGYDVLEIKYHKLHEKVQLTPFFNDDMKVNIVDARDMELYALKGASCLMQ
ncbi:MAG: hypothetical protein HON90_08725 [Halobacteriovoraceae bacterium]|nr:hypothetical protein [Halobacteriovoraceae bacterium]